MKKIRWVPLLVAVAAASVWMWAAQQRAGNARGLAADLPPGALMTVESDDFSHLLADWNSSQEQGAWMHSASFQVFTNSRLYGRLTDAEQEFAGAGGTDFGSSFLRSVAGTQSIFAWYDIGNLEFLYITRLKPGQSNGIELLSKRAHFTERKVGDTVFYVRTGGAAPGDNDSTQPDAAQQGKQRTIAFGQRGDLLLLATREDLLANALQLMQAGAKAPSLVDDGWYAAASKAAPAQRGDLRMLLDLDRLTRTPQFRSYWIQRNVTEMRQYRAAEVDLYREAGQLREERVLLPTDASMPSHDSSEAMNLATLVPEDAGVFQSTASPSPEAILAELRDKVLERSAAQNDASTSAPDADLSVSAMGDTSDLETRIDAVQTSQPAPDAWLAALRASLQDVPVTAMLSVSRAAAEPTSLFLPIHSAVVLRRDGPWNEAQLETAVLSAQQARLTVGGVGLAWRETQGAGGKVMVATGAQPMAMVVHGNTAIVGTDESIVRAVLARSNATPAAAQPASLLAEFRPAQAQPAFLQLTATLDHSPATGTPDAAASADDAATDAPAPGQTADAQASQSSQDRQPAFLHDNLGSLGGSFSSLARERFLERREGDHVRQTVLYQWKSAATASP